MAHIRSMAESDAITVAALWDHNCFEVAGRHLSDDESAGVLALLRQYPSNKDAFCFVAEEQNRIVGFITACLISHPVTKEKAGEIEELYVQPVVRGKGIGSELVWQVVSLMRQQDISVIRAHACVESSAAMAFWQHLGWEYDMATFSLRERIRY